MTEVPFASDNELMPKAPDFLEALLQSIVERVKMSLKPEIEVMIANAVINISADQIDGLEKFVDNCFEEHTRNINIDAYDVENLDDYIRAGLKEATIEIRF